jgi:YVTN family beta-propeller protein
VTIKATGLGDETEERGEHAMHLQIRRLAQGRRSRFVSGAVIGAGLAAALVLGVIGTGGVSGTGAAAPKDHAAVHGRVLLNECGGPTGTAFVADAGYDAFSQINTANCAVVQNGGYNVGDTEVTGDSGDYNYSSTDEGVIATGGNLWFANAGTNDVAVIDIASLDPSDYNPTETLINTGFNPQSLAATPNGAEVWVTDTGPETSPSSPSDVDVIDTSTKKVVATIPISGAPSNIAFSPNGAEA